MLKLRHQNRELKDIWLVEPEVTLGSDPACDVVLSRPGIQPRHVAIRINGNAMTVVNLAGDPGVMVNGVPCGREHALAVNNSLSLGGAVFVVVDPRSEMDAMLIEAGQSGWAIRANHSALNNRVYAISDDTVIGRSTDCDIVFTVTHLSRKHAQLSIRDGGLVVKDLGSSNGTFVNGQRVSETRLHHNDELKLDTLCFTVIGPNDERDKTTVRSAVSMTPPPEAGKTPAPEAPAKPRASDVIRSGERLGHAPATGSDKPAADPVPSSTAPWLLVATVLVLGSIIAAILLL